MLRPYSMISALLILVCTAFAVANESELWGTTGVVLIFLWAIVCHDWLAVDDGKTVWQFLFDRLRGRVDTDPSNEILTTLQFQRRRAPRPATEAPHMPEVVALRLECARLKRELNDARQERDILRGRLQNAANGYQVGKGAVFP